MSSLKKSSTTINELYKGLNVITELLKNINTAVKDDLAANQKINEATETFVKISSNITGVLSLVKGFDFSAFLSIVKDLQAHALKQDEELAAWAKSSTIMAWNLGSIISGLERTLTHIRSSMSSLQKDTHSIKSMMTEMYTAFKGQLSSAPSGSVTLTLTLNDTPANVEGENATNTTTEEPLSHTEGRLHSLSPSSIQNLLSHRERAKYWDKEEKIKKAEKEARLNAISEHEVIKVVREEAKKLGIHPKEAITNKAAFGISELDELREIIPKNKNAVVKDLMNSLSRRYETLRQILRELGIQSSIPAPAPEQAPSQPEEENESTWNLSLKQESLDWNAI
ncbi:hypothetical protein Tco_1100250 [Tanacetum coccineum]